MRSAPARLVLITALAAVALALPACGPKASGTGPTDPQDGGKTGGVRPAVASGDITRELPADTFFLFMLENPRAFFEAIQLRAGLERVGDDFRNAEREAEQVLGSSPYSLAGLEKLGVDVSGPAGFALFGT